MAIFTIVALGVGFLSGLLVTTPDMRQSIGAFFDECNFMDLSINGTLGLTQQDADAVAGLPCVSSVMLQSVGDLKMLGEDGNSTVARVHGVQDFTSETLSDINRTKLASGRYPISDNECVIEALAIADPTLALGKALTVSHENDGDDILKNKTYTIVGTVTSPFYISRIDRGHSNVGNGRIGVIMYLNQNQFVADYYTDLYVTLNGRENESFFSSGYDKLMDEGTAAVSTLAETQRLVRRDSLVADANLKLADARQELAEGEAEAKQKLLDAREELERAEKKIKNGKAELAKGRREMAKAQSELQSGELEGRQKIKDAEADIAENQLKLSDALAKIKDAEAQLTDGRKKLADGLQELTDGEKQLADAKIEIAENQQKLDDAERELFIADQKIASGWDEYDKGMKQLEGLQKQLEGVSNAIAALTAAGDTSSEQYQQLVATKMQLDDACTLASGTLNAAAAQLRDGEDASDQGFKQLNAGRQQLKAGVAEINANEAKLVTARQDWQAAAEKIESSQAQLAEARLEYDDGTAKLQSGKLELENAKATLEKELADGNAQIETARLKLSNAEKNIKKGETEVATGWQEYISAEVKANDELNDGKQKISDAEREIGEMDDPKWYVFDRRDNRSYAGVSSDTTKVGAIARVFPVFFFAIATLVSSTTMTRMADEERGLIGTMKALGYSNGVIAAKYIAYALLASLAGCVAGLSVGLWLFPKIIWSAYELVYNLPALLLGASASYGTISSVIIVAGILLATVMALGGALRENAASLMLPKAPPPGKRILLERVTPLWRKIKFTHKVTLRNLMLYKKRFFMTVIGIAGCTALLVTGFGLRDSINDIIDKQFGELSKYNLIVAVKEAGDEMNDTRLKAVFGDETAIKSYMPMFQEAASAAANGEKVDAYISVPQRPEDIGEFSILRERRGHKPLALQSGTVLISEKAASVLDVKVGEKITLKNSNNDEAQFAIGGIFENYVENYIYMTDADYATAFNESCKYTMLLCNANVADSAARDGLSERLLRSSNTLAAQFTKDISGTYNDMLKSIDSIVIVLILSAGVLAFVVLYNLTNINICERNKEIATIKVLGFFGSEVSAYIYRETLILSFVGAIVGLFAGVLLHRFVVLTAEVAVVMFGRTISPLSFLYSAAITIGFTIIVSIVMGFKLRSINMVESLKAPE